ncbi:TAXI family TRAP transporter solute-binding subunit [Pseudonocardia sp. ICBG601]|uniref:TAXI family TRAP transporter solute-binding subunit n=1 Tax=Pseudonocardia sp. ICBG601 TaxID=2846759 RepID=UPI001CF6E67D|nr:TAXI family TRAP transporter solute-binding subunit [Pseudonocardia sp. ICBG601]
MSARGQPRRSILGGLCLLPMLTSCTSVALDELSLAAGEPGGFYAEFADLLAAVSRSAGWPLRPVTTGGSRSNAELVIRGGADVGLALTDLVLAARAGAAPFAAPLELLAIGRLYENYLQLAVRSSAPFIRLADLAGRAVSLGTPGSGASLLGTRLVAAAGITVRACELNLAAATAALADGRIDAFLWSGGVPTPAVSTLMGQSPVRLLPLAEHLPALRARYGIGPYSTAVMPAGVYGAATPIATIGVANLLVAAPTLPGRAAEALARLLVERASDLVPTSALGIQYFDQPVLVDTGDVPLHPGAADAYRELHG